MDSLIDVLDDAAGRFGDRPAFGLRTDDGRSWTWTFRELERRSRIAAWRLRALGLAARRPAADVVAVHAAAAGHLLRGDAGGPDPRAARPADGVARRSAIVAERADAPLARPRHGPRRARPRGGRPRAAFPTTTVEELTAEPDATFPADWEAQVARLAPAGPRGDLRDSSSPPGRPARPKGVMLAHDNVLATLEAIHRVIPPMDHRVVSLLPLSHLLEQAVGAVLRARRRRRHPATSGAATRGSIFEAIRDHRVTTMVVVPQVLDLFWSAIEREVEKQGRRGGVRPPARRSPDACRSRCGGCIFRRVHAQLGGGAATCSSRPGAFLPPALQQAWEDLGVIVIQGYGSTENGFGTINTSTTTASGRWAGRSRRSRCGSPTTARSCSADRPCSRATGDDPEATTGRSTPTAGTTGDIGQLDDGGRLVLMGRTKDMIVLPERLQGLPRGHRERAPKRGHPRLGRRRDAAGPDRGGRPRVRGGEPATPADRGRGGQGGRTRTPRPAPAGRGVAALARGGLPAHPHAQGQARPGPRVGRSKRRRMPVRQESAASAG